MMCLQNAGCTKCWNPKTAKLFLVFFFRHILRPVLFCQVVVWLHQSWDLYMLSLAPFPLPHCSSSILDWSLVCVFCLLTVEAGNFLTPGLSSLLKQQLSASSSCVWVDCSWAFPWEEPEPEEMCFARYQPRISPNGGVFFFRAISTSGLFPGEK